MYIVLNSNYCVLKAVYKDTKISIFLPKWNNFIHKYLEKCNYYKTNRIAQIHFEDCFHYDMPIAILAMEENWPAMIGTEV